MEDEPLQLVAIIYSQDELAVLTSRLRCEGIWCFRHSERQIGANVGWTLALGGVRLFVRREDAAAARALLTDVGRWQRVGGVYDRSRIIDWTMALFLALMTGIPTPARMPGHVVGAVSETETA